jgi:hypothetical protein
VDPAPHMMYGRQMPFFNFITIERFKMKQTDCNECRINSGGVKCDGGNNSAYSLSSHIQSHYETHILRTTAGPNGDNIHVRACRHFEEAMKQILFDNNSLVTTPLAT